MDRKEEDRRREEGEGEGERGRRREAGGGGETEGSHVAVQVGLEVEDHEAEVAEHGELVEALSGRQQVDGNGRADDAQHAHRATFIG